MWRSALFAPPGLGLSLLLTTLLTGCGSDDGGQVAFTGDGTAVGPTSTTDSARCLAVGGDQLFFVASDADDRGLIRTVPLAGGPVADVVTLAGAADHLVGDGQSLWWIEAAAGVGAVRRVAVAGGEVATVAEGLQQPSALALDDRYIYWAEQSSGAIWQAPKEGGSPLLLATGAANVVTALASDGAWLYFTQAYDLPHGSIQRVAVSGGGVEQVVADLGTPMALALSGERVCWYALMGGSIGCAPKQGGVAVSLDRGLSFLPTTCSVLALDEAGVYYPAREEIRRAPQEGGAAALVARTAPGTFFVRSLVLAGDELYWSEDGALRKIDRAHRVVRDDGNDDESCGPGGLAVDAGCRACLQSSCDGEMTAAFGAGYADGAYAGGACPDLVSCQCGCGDDVACSTGCTASVGSACLLPYSSALQCLTSTCRADCVEGGGPIPTCSSDYDGSYLGLFTYEYDVPDEQGGRSTVVDSVGVTLALTCLATAAGSTVLTVTHAIADDPWFGCTLGGCVPLLGSVATLPAEPPTTPSNPSRSGQGIVVLFPNGASLGTTNGEGALTVSSQGRTLANSLDPRITDSTWVAASTDSGAESFPTGRPANASAVRWKSWSLSWSAR